MTYDTRAAWLLPQPADTALSLPAACYADADWHRVDRGAIFARTWQLVARAEQVSAAGDHVVTEVAGVPLVIMRGADGVLRALHNVCRHRAGPLALCDGRGARQLSCKYHGWTYALDGRLLGAPAMGRAPGFDPADIRLPAAQVAVWQGLVFVALGNGGVPPFDEVVAGIDARIDRLMLSSYTFHQRATYDVACNWKVYVDNYLEGYHVGQVHAGLAALLDAEQYTTHTGAWHVLQTSPLASEPALYGNGSALYFFLYPNTMLNILPGRLQTNRVVPLDAERCRVDFDYYYAGHVGAAQRCRDIEFSDRVQAEDAAVCGAVQRGLASGSYDTGRLNPQHESGVHHFHELLRRAYRTYPDAAAAGGR
jgi:choline monooxygenase